MLLVNCSFKYSFLDEIEKESRRKVDSFGKVEQPEISKEYRDVIDFFENLEPSGKMKKVSEFTIFERPFEMYIINP